MRTSLADAFAGRSVFVTGHTRGRRPGGRRRVHYPGSWRRTGAGGRVSRCWVAAALDTFEDMLDGGVWHLWGHSWELASHRLWDAVELVLRTVSGHSGVAYLFNPQTLEWGRSAAFSGALAG